MKFSTDSLDSGQSTYACPPWLRSISVATLPASIVFLSTSILLRQKYSGFDILIPSLIVALAGTIVLIAYTLRHLLTQQQQLDRAFRHADCESSSIFQHVLDGILIVDSAGVCLDANPAAAEILRCKASDLIGQDISRFLPQSAETPKDGNPVLQHRQKRGRARLVARDETEVFVDFNAISHYLPDRHVFVLCDVTERTNAEALLRESEERFHSMANNIQEIVWMMDVATRELVYVNQAFETITGHRLPGSRTISSFYRDLIYYEDRARVLNTLQHGLITGVFDEEFRFIRADGALRWIWLKGFPVPSDADVRWIVGTAQEITSRKQVEMKLSEQVDATEAARAEAQALRKAALALSQNLAMDAVLDTLLECISGLIPFGRSAVLFLEDGFNLMIARETPCLHPKRRIGLTVKASDNPFFQKILIEKQSLLVSDVASDAKWADMPPLDHLRSWLGIPLVAANGVLGVLFFGSNTRDAFTSEHVRLAESLAIPAAVAIQNARTHERAEIYASELERRLG